MSLLKRILAVGLLVVACAFGQREEKSGTLDITNAKLIPPHGSTLPATCTPPQWFHLDSATAGENFHLCTSMHTWTRISAAASGWTYDAGTSEATATGSAVIGTAKISRGPLATWQTMLRPKTSNAGGLLEISPNGDPGAGNPEAMLSLCGTDWGADQTNFECLNLKAQDGAYYLMADAGGTGVLREIVFQTGLGDNRSARLMKNGHFLIGTNSDLGTLGVYDSTPSTGVTTAIIRAGAGQSTSSLLSIQDSAGDDNLIFHRMADGTTQLVVRGSSGKASEVHYAESGVAHRGGIGFLAGSGTMRFEVGGGQLGAGALGLSLLPTTGTPKMEPSLVGSLEACSSATEGAMRPVTDSATTAAGATITGSGTNHVLAYCNGTNWTVSSGSSTPYPGSGVPNSTGSAWGTSYTVGTSANNLIRLNGSGNYPLSSDFLTEGSTNQWFTTARARSAFSAGTGISITDGVISATGGAGNASSINGAAVPTTGKPVKSNGSGQLVDAEQSDYAAYQLIPVDGTPGANAVLRYNPTSQKMEDTGCTLTGLTFSCVGAGTPYSEHAEGGPPDAPASGRWRTFFDNTYHRMAAIGSSATYYFPWYTVPGSSGQVMLWDATSGIIGVPRTYYQVQANGTPATAAAALNFGSEFSISGNSSATNVSVNEIAQSKVTGLVNDLANKAPADSPTFTGTITTPLSGCVEGTPGGGLIGTGEPCGSGGSGGGVGQWSGTLDFPAMCDLCTADLTFSATGATVGTMLQVIPPVGIESGLEPRAWVSAADTVKVRLLNVSGAAINPASGTYTVLALRGLLSTTASLTSWATACDGCAVTKTVTLTGATTTMAAVAYPPAALAAGWQPSARVTAANTVTVTLYNATGAAATPADGTFGVSVIQ